jgi:hypothetical protein
MLRTYQVNYFPQRNSEIQFSINKEIQYINHFKAISINLVQSKLQTCLEKTKGVLLPKIRIIFKEGQYKIFSKLIKVCMGQNVLKYKNFYRLEEKLLKSAELKMIKG